MIGTGAWHWRRRLTDVWTISCCGNAGAGDPLQAWSRGVCGGIYPWKEPITSLYRGRVEQGLPPFEMDDAWPWNEAFFPKLSTITNQDGQ
jgi:hypothetical protein